MSNQNVDVVDLALTITRLKEENDKKDKLIYDLRKRNHELLERNRYLEQSVKCQIKEHVDAGARFTINDLKKRF